MEAGGPGGAEHPVALKVMRLTRPGLGAGADSLLQLPQSFGNIYLGETFSCYVCVCVCGEEHEVEGVSVRADLQTSSARVALGAGAGAGAVGARLAPGAVLGDLISHEVKDLGTHILVCEVTYADRFRTLVSFRKFFKFEVLKPLDVKTKFYNAESDHVYLEAQVQNVTSSPITLERVALESSQQFTVKSLNETKDGASVFGDVTFLRPKESCQYLYCLTPKLNVATDLKRLAAAKNIGKLDIVWRSNLGEKGRLQTSQLQRMSPEYGDIRLTFENLPNKTNVEEPFEFKCKIFNACERSLDLILKLRSHENSGLLWCGISNRKLGSLEPGSSAYIELTAFPVDCGLQLVSGISLVDLFLNRTYDYDDLASIYVC